MEENTKLFSLLDKVYIQQWRKDIEEQMKNDQDLNLANVKDVLTTFGLPEPTINIIIARIVDRLDFIHVKIEKKLINLCVNLGIELGKCN